MVVQKTLSREALATRVDPLAAAVEVRERHRCKRVKKGFRKTCAVEGRGDVVCQKICAVEGWVGVT